MCSNIPVCFVQSCLRKSTTNGYETGVNMINTTGITTWQTPKTKSWKQRKIEQKNQLSHMINNLLTSLARSVRKSICLRVFCSDLTRSSFGLYENFRQILFSTLTSCYCFSHLIFCHIIFFLVYIYKFTRFCIHSMFLSDEGPTLEAVDFTLSAVH